MSGCATLFGLEAERVDRLIYERLERMERRTLRWRISASTERASVEVVIGTPRMILRAWFWTVSSFFWARAEAEDRMVGAYSRRGRIQVLYRLIKV